MTASHRHREGARLRLLAGSGQVTIQGETLHALLAEIDQLTKERDEAYASIAALIAHSTQAGEDLGLFGEDTA